MIGVHLLPASSPAARRFPGISTPPSPRNRACRPPRASPASARSGAGSGRSRVEVHGPRRRRPGHAAGRSARCPSRRRPPPRSCAARPRRRGRRRYRQFELLEDVVAGRAPGGGLRPRAWVSRPGCRRVCTEPGVSTSRSHDNSWVRSRVGVGQGNGRPGRFVHLPADGAHPAQRSGQRDRHEPTVHHTACHVRQQRGVEHVVDRRNDRDVYLVPCACGNRLTRLRAHSNPVNPLPTISTEDIERSVPKSEAQTCQPVAAVSTSHSRMGHLMARSPVWPLGSSAAAGHAVPWWSSAAALLPVSSGAAVAYRTLFATLRSPGGRTDPDDQRRRR